MLTSLLPKADTAETRKTQKMLLRSLRTAVGCRGRCEPARISTFRLRTAEATRRTASTATPRLTRTVSTAHDTPALCSGADSTWERLQNEAVEALAQSTYHGFGLCSMIKQRVLAHDSLASGLRCCSHLTHAKSVTPVVAALSSLHTCATVRFSVRSSQNARLLTSITLECAQLPMPQTQSLWR